VNKTTCIAVLCLYVAFILTPAAVVFAQTDPAPVKDAATIQAEAELLKAQNEAKRVQAETITAQAQADMVQVEKQKATAMEALSKSQLGHFGVCIGAGLAAAGGGIGIAVLGSAVIAASARQPEMRGQLTTIMFIVAALVEGLTLFAIVVCIMCLFM
jgi:F-type H+-transporting ATPase subunit c